ncbi:hypothetical protein HY989_02255 [Candidatus Micrarchaeota archaeon]|nr:hypothetical protein [Candidatus Micrarchaeota archaeon]
MFPKQKKSRGIIYSLITLMLVLPLLVYLMAYVDTSAARDEVAVLKIRGIELSNYVHSINEDVPRIFKITASRALIAAVNEIDINGTPLDDANMRITELMVNSTIYGQNSSFMNGSTLTGWASRMSNLGTKYGLMTNISFLNVSVKPYDSFTLEFSMVLFVNSTDSDGTVTIARYYNESYFLSLDGFEDFLYSLNTKGFAKRIIHQYPGYVANVSDVDSLTSTGYYLNSTLGPSYLDRMEGKLFQQSKYVSQTNRQIGLESIVDIQKLLQVGQTISANQTDVDYQYFNSTFIQGCAVVGSSTSWLKLDATHATQYGVSISC